MRVIRFLVLLIVIGVAFLATPTFELRPFASQIPSDFLAESDFMANFRQWVADDLARSALLLTGWAALTFGLLAVPWPYRPLVVHAPATHTSTAQDDHSERRSHFRRWGGILSVLLALGAGLSAHLLLSTMGEAPLVHLLWVASLLLLLLSGALFTSPRIRKHSSADTTSNRQNGVHAARRSHVTDGWPLMLIVLLLGALLYGWKATTIPVGVEERTAQLGLRALAMVTGEDTRLFAVTAPLSRPEDARFGLAAASTAIVYWLSGDLLWSTRLIGVVGALGCALATWLVGVELFARRPRPTPTVMPIEDQGQSAALMAMWFVLFQMATLYFSRQPVLLEATAWGLLSCWALLRAFRRSDRLVLSLSGLLVGFSYALHGSALVFGVTTLLWWLGMAAQQAGALPHLTRTVRGRRLRGADFLLWLLCIIAAIAPFAIVRGQELALWRHQLPTSIESALTGLLTNFAPPVDLYPGPLFHFILLPFFPLALGLLLFNLDRRQGWMLTTLLASGLAFAAMIQPQTFYGDLLLPLVPAVALVLAFTLDRMRVSLIRMGGRWTLQFVGFALLGLMLWIGSSTVIAYHTFARLQHTPTANLGYALRQMAKEQAILVYLPDSAAAPLGVTAENAQADLTLRFFTNERIDADDSGIQFTDHLEYPLVAGTVVVLAPTEKSEIDALRTFYPDATVAVIRDVHANPLVFLLKTPLSD